jgi:hypothetical protein
MHRTYRHLLIAALILATGAAWAQSIGLGLGISDLPSPQGVQGGAPPPTHNLLLVASGNILLVGGGNIQCVGSC